MWFKKRCQHPVGRSLATGGAPGHLHVLGSHALGIVRFVSAANGEERQRALSADMYLQDACGLPTRFSLFSLPNTTYKSSGGSSFASNRTERAEFGQHNRTTRYRETPSCAFGTGVASEPLRRMTQLLACEIQIEMIRKMRRISARGVLDTRFGQSQNLTGASLQRLSQASHAFRCCCFSSTPLATFPAAATAATAATGPEQECAARHDGRGRGGTKSGFKIVMMGYDYSPLRGDPLGARPVASHPDSCGARTERAYACKRSTTMEDHFSRMLDASATGR